MLYTADKRNKIDKDLKPQGKLFHEIIPIEKCFIQNEQTEELAKFIFDFIMKNNISIYDEETGKGIVRHIVTKIGVKTNQIMCIIVINGEKIPQEQELVEKIKSNFSNVKTIVKNINTKNTNVILGERNINLFGDGYIEDILGEYTFKISPLSFYQVNPIQAEKLYILGIEGAQITKGDVVFDLYCGIGTISLFMSKYAKKVYGIEIVEEAIKAAKENAVLNGVTNTEFIAGDVEQILDDLINVKNIVPDIVLISKGKELFIEIFVTHRIDEVKLEKLKQANISTMLKHVFLYLRIGRIVLKFRHIHVFQRELNADFLGVDISLGK